MRRWLGWAEWAARAALVGAAWTSGCGGQATGAGGSGAGGSAPSCAQVVDCPQPQNDCQLATCDAGACGLVAKPGGAICAQGAGTCDGNGQCNLCEPGFATCNGSTLLVCGESGTFDDPITCGGDTPYCNPVDPKCVECLDTSQCVTPGMNPCLAVACLENACATTLVPDGSPCLLDGDMGVCNDGVCLECTPGAKECSGNDLLVCGVDGQLTAAPCSGGTPYCDPATSACAECLLESQCPPSADPCGVPACTAGSCGYVPGSNGVACAVGTDTGSCEAGSCAVCTNGSKRCKAGADTPQLCVAGLWVDQAACQAPTPSCSAGVCTPAVCAPPKHVCGGICTPNTPATGCYQSVSCNPCPAPPSFGTSVCTMGGLCDFVCQPPYVKQGSVCGCASECCSSADCNGGTCQNGSCTDPPPPPCDPGGCTADCFAMCFPGFGLGVCEPINNSCLCTCM
jgi:hypothetical protein